MGAASCKKTDSKEIAKESSKNITIGVFGLDNAGKTSAVKAIDGVPTADVMPTASSAITMVTHKLAQTNDDNKKQTTQQQQQQKVKMIDVSGAKKFRQQSWSQFYDQIHGLIFVIDASETRRMKENRQTLEDLLNDVKLKDKPILILANKQDIRGAIDDEEDLKQELHIERLKTTHKVEFCTATPKGKNQATSKSIRDGFAWLIKTIEGNYSSLNARVMASSRNRTNTTRKNEESDRSLSDGDSDNGFAKKRSGVGTTSRNQTNKTTDRFGGTTHNEKLPPIKTASTKSKVGGYDTYSEDDEYRPRPRSNARHYGSDNDENYRSSKQPISSVTNGTNKKKNKVIGGGSSGTSTGLALKKTNDIDPKPFRSPYEPFPEDAPWSSTSTKTTKKDDIYPKPFLKPSLSGDTTRRNVSPLVHDIKPYGTGLSTKRYSDDEDDADRRNKSKTTTYPSTSTTNRFNTNSSNRYDDEDYKTKLDDRKYTSSSPSTVKKPTTTTSSYGGYNDDDYDSSYHRTGTTPTVAKKTYKKSYDDDDDEDDYLHKASTKMTSPSKSNPKYGSDDEDDYRHRSDRTNLNSEYRGTSAKQPSSTVTTRPKYNDDDYPFSSSKRNTEIDSYYPSTNAKKSTYPSNDDYSGTSRSHFDNDKYGTTKGGYSNARASSASAGRLRSHAEEDS